MAEIVNPRISDDAAKHTLLVAYSRDFYAWLHSCSEYDELWHAHEMIAIKNSNWCYWYRLLARIDDATTCRARVQFAERHASAGISFGMLCSEINFFFTWFTECANIDRQAIKLLRAMIHADLPFIAQFYVAVQNDKQREQIVVQQDIVAAITLQFEKFADYDFSLLRGTRFGNQGALPRAFARACKSMQELATFARRISKGSTATINDVALSPENELGAVLIALDERVKDRANEEAHALTKNAMVRELMLLASGAQNIKMLAHQTMSLLGKRLNAIVGSFYRIVSDGDEKTLQIIGSLAADRTRRIGEEISLRHAFLAPVIASRQIAVHAHLTDNSYLLDVGFAQLCISHLVIVPIVIDDEVFGVIEIGSPKPLSASDLELLGDIRTTLIPLIKSHVHRERIRILIEESNVAKLRLSTQRVHLLRTQGALMSADGCVV